MRPSPSKTVLLLLSCGLALGCERLFKSTSSGNVKLQLPAKRMSSANANVRNQSATSLWGVAAPSTAGEADCYAVYLQAADLQAGSCLAQDGTTIHSISRLFGQFAAGSNIEIEMPIGNGRTIGVYAFNSSTGTCEAAVVAGFDSSKYSTPVLIGSTTLDVKVGPNTASISASFKDAKTVESCLGDAFAGLPGQSWPACSLGIGKVAYNNGQMNIAGACLNGATSVAIRDETTSSVTPLTIAAKSASLLTAKLSGNLTLAAGHVYKLLISTAYGDSSVPFTLTLGDGSVPVSAIAAGSIDGQVVTYDATSGKAIWKSASGGGGNALRLKSGTTDIGKISFLDTNGFLISTANGNLVRYWKKNFLYSGFNNLNLMPSIFAIDPLIAALPVDDLVQLGFIRSPSQVYFTGTNCSGDVLVQSDTTGQSIIGRLVVEPKDCSYVGMGLGYQCTGTTQFAKLTGTPTYTSSLAILSTAYQGTMPMDTYLYCQSTSGSLNGYLFTDGTQVVPLSAGDPPTLISSPTFVK
jgi:WD40 repeat protein